MIALNQVLSGKYRITGRLAGGGMSTVYTAEDVQLGKTWAVKVLDTSRSEYKRLMREDGTLDEIEILKALDHPLAPRMVDMFRLGDDICIVMDLVKGESLQAVLDREGAQSEEQAADWMRDICGLLSYLHANGIIYRDLKPSNIILCGDRRVKLVDFGYPTKIVRDGVFADREAFGTPGYAAPEQVKRYSDARSDVYSAGVTLRQLVTGVPPKAKGRKSFRKKHDAQISPGMRAIIEKAESQSPKNRFASMDELCDALLNYKKAEKPYIEGLRKKLAVSSALLYTGLSLLLSGILVFEGFYLRDLHDYRSLTGIENASEAELLSAAELLPSRAEAFEALADLYSRDGLSEEELERLGALAEKFESAVFIKSDAYYDLYYRIACCIMCRDAKTSFCDVRERLEKASPYLRKASAGGSRQKEASVLVSILEGLSGDGGSHADAAVSLINSQPALLGRDSSDLLLFQDAAILTLLDWKRDAVEAERPEKFIQAVLERIESDVISSSSENAGSVLELLSEVKSRAGDDR